MNYLKHFALAVGLIGATAAQAAIINVNNASPSPGDYDNITDAVTNASPGDTLYLAPTNLNYGNVDIDKQLHIIGPGFNISGGVLGSFAELGTVVFINGTQTSGSSIESVKVSRIDFNDPASLAMFSNFTIQRCYITQYIYAYNDILSNSVIEGCIFSFATYNTFPSNYSNLTIQNNFFRGPLFAVTNSVITQNIFVGTGTEAWFSNISSSSLTNNIIVGKNVNVAVGTNSISGNCSFGGSSDTFQGTGVNLEGVDPEFVNFSGPEFSFASDLNLAGSSPLLGAGAGGEDIGIYGGSGVYRQDCEPTIPIIRSVNIPGGTTVPANATFNINIVSEAHE